MMLLLLVLVAFKRAAERKLHIIIIKTMFAVVGEITSFEKPMKRNFN